MAVVPQARRRAPRITPVHVMTATPTRLARISAVASGRHELSIGIMPLSKLPHSLSAKCDKWRVTVVGRRPKMSCRSAVRHRGETVPRRPLAHVDNRWHVNCFAVSEDSRQRPNDHERFLPRTRGTLARKPGVARGRSVGKPARRFAVARPTGSLGGTRRARQRRALRLLIRITAHVFVAATRPTGPPPRGRTARHPVPLARYLPPGGLFFGISPGSAVSLSRVNASQCPPSPR